MTPEMLLIVQKHPTPWRVCYDDCGCLTRWLNTVMDANGHVVQFLQGKLDKSVSAYEFAVGVVSMVNVMAAADGLTVVGDEIDAARAEIRRAGK